MGKKTERKKTTQNKTKNLIKKTIGEAGYITTGILHISHILRFYLFILHIYTISYS